MSIRTASFQSTYTTAVVTTTSTIADEDTYRVRIIDSAAPQVGFYSWDFTELDAAGFTPILNEIGNGSITGMQISLSYNNNNDGKGIEFSKYVGDNPDGATGGTLLNGATRFEVGRFDIETSNRTNITIDLFDYNLFYDAHLEIASRNYIAFVIRRRKEFESSNGNIELGGKTLLAGVSGDWRAATGSEVTAPPLLIIQYEIAEKPNPLLSMKYTTSDPTTPQNTPENSLGGHSSSNDIYPFGDIRESISSVQTTVPIDLDSALPTKTGLASVGPEIFKYTLIDTANHRLSGVIRGITPAASFPAGFDSFRIAERVQYLHKDTNDVHKLFDTRAASGLMQYRCVAIVNDNSEHDFDLRDAFVGVVQDPLSDVQVHIGLEFPKHDSFLGVAEAGTSTTQLVDSALNEAAGFETGFFNGSFITFPTLGLSRVVISFDDGQFQIATTAGLGPGDDYVIKPAPSQTIANDATAPTTNSGRFGGFSETGEGIAVQLLDHSTTMQEYDAFYVWIRRTLTFNVKSSDDTGAVLLFRYREV